MDGGCDEEELELIQWQWGFHRCTKITKNLTRQERIAIKQELDNAHSAALRESWWICDKLLSVRALGG
jgi:hypothetical protein